MKKPCSTNKKLFYIANILQKKRFCCNLFSFWYWKFCGTVKNHSFTFYNSCINFQSVKHFFTPTSVTIVMFSTLRISLPCFHRVTRGPRWICSLSFYDVCFWIPCKVFFGRKSQYLWRPTPPLHYLDIYMNEVINWIGVINFINFFSLTWPNSYKFTFEIVGHTIHHCVATGIVHITANLHVDLEIRVP